MDFAEFCDGWNKIFVVDREGHVVYTPSGTKMPSAAALPALSAGQQAGLGRYPIVTFEKQLLNMIGNLV